MHACTCKTTQTTSQQTNLSLTGNRRPAPRLTLACKLTNDTYMMVSQTFAFHSCSKECGRIVGRQRVPAKLNCLLPPGSHERKTTKRSGTDYFCPLRVVSGRHIIGRGPPYLWLTLATWTPGTSTVTFVGSLIKQHPPLSEEQPQRCNS